MEKVNFNDGAAAPLTVSKGHSAIRQDLIVWIGVQVGDRDAAKSFQILIYSSLVISSAEDLGTKYSVASFLSFLLHRYHCF